MTYFKVGGRNHKLRAQMRVRSHKAQNIISRTSSQILYLFLSAYSYTLPGFLVEEGDGSFSSVCVSALGEPGLVYRHVDMELARLAHQTGDGEDDPSIKIQYKHAHLSVGCGLGMPDTFNIATYKGRVPAEAAT